MQVDEKNTRPISLWAHLYQQVQEQSEFCDVTVEVNLWKRKYHWCVLSASPFFVKLYESKLQEQQTGVIKLFIGNSNSVEAALNFLYGQRPNITIENAGDMFEIAEFLMIDELKALCIERMRVVPVNTGNCLKLFLLMSLYDFDLRKTSDFILAHLTELLEMDEMLLVNKDSVRYIITEPMLFYVSREDCFRFLLKWTKHCPTRQLDFPELLSCLKDVSKDMLNSVDISCLTENNIYLCSTLSNVSKTPRDILILFLTESISRKHIFYVYSFELNAWFQLLFQHNSIRLASNLAKLKNRNTLIRLSHDTKTAMYYNMENKIVTEKSVDVAFCDERPELKHLNYINNKLYCLGNFEYYIDYYIEENDPYDQDHDPYDQDLCLFGYRDSPTNQGLEVEDCMEGCSVCFAQENEEDKITFKPLISIRGTPKAFCVVEQFACLLMEERQLLIYAVNDFLTTLVNLTEHTTDEVTSIFPCHVGGLYVVTKASILQTDIQMKNNEIITTVVDTWKMKKTEDSESSDNSELNRFPTRFEVVEDKLITIARCPKNNEYTFYYQMLPTKIGLLDKEEKLELVVPERLKRESDVQFLQMRLTKDSLRCHIDCPQCKETDQDPYRSYYDRDDDLDEYIYYDDPGDDYVPEYDRSDYDLDLDSIDSTDSMTVAEILRSRAARIPPMHWVDGGPFGKFLS